MAIAYACVVACLRRRRLMPPSLPDAVLQHL
jgi:hypothetical protein